MVVGNILGAVERLGADTIKEQKKAYEDLELLLSNLQSSSKFQELADVKWHKALNALFSLIERNKSDVLEGSATAKNRATSRLQKVADALKLVINSCNDVIPPKTASAVFDHIISVLAPNGHNEDEYQQLVQGQCLHSFRVLLSNSIHGEHLRPKDWERYVMFILTLISSYLYVPDAVVGEGEPASYQTSFSGASTRSTIAIRNSQTSSSRRSRHRAPPQLLDDLVECLRCLTSLSNCPLKRRIQHIAQVILEVLDQINTSKDAAFTCLNNVILVAVTENTELACNIAASLAAAIEQSWPGDLNDRKSVRIREQMVTSLLLLRQYLSPKPSLPSTVSSDVVASLAESLLARYVARSNNESLNLSDVVLSRSNSDDFFCRKGMSPDLASPVAVLKWSTTSMIAMLMPPSAPQSEPQSFTEDQHYNPRKRPRLSTPLPELIRLLFLDEASISTEDVQTFLVKQVPCISDDWDRRSSWILLTLARLCQISAGRRQELAGQWSLAWAAASQLISSTMNSRAACFAMMTMLDSGVVSGHLTSSRLINSCFQGGARGPPSISDGALLLFSSCLRSKLLTTERHLQELRDKIMSWLDALWQLPAVGDHANNVQLASMVRPDFLLDLFNAMLALPLRTRQDSNPSSASMIYQAFIQQREDSLLAEYLVNPAILTTKDAVAENREVPIVSDSIVRNKQYLQLLCKFLQQKLEAFIFNLQRTDFGNGVKDSYKPIEHIHKPNLSIETAEIICTACTVASEFCDAAEDHQLRTSIMSSWHCILDYLKVVHHNISTFEVSFSRVAQRFLTIQSLDSRGSTKSTTRGQLAWSLREVAATFEQNQSNITKFDPEFASVKRDSQRSQNRSQKNAQDSSPKAADDNHVLFVESNALLLRDTTCRNQSESAEVAHIMTKFVLGLSTEELLAVRGTLIETFRDLPLDASDSALLLRRIAEVCLTMPENDHNEAALAFCLDMLHMTLPLWIHTEHESLVEVALDIYSYFVEAALGKNVASTRVLYKLSLILESLLQTNPRYGTNSQEPLQSPRTSLLQILKRGTSSLKFRLVPCLTKLFEGYVLTEHAAVFDDIVDCLPTDPDDIEGIAVRLYALAKLGSAWKTVLRQAVYHIFETAANVTFASTYAHTSLQLIASDFGSGYTSSTILHLFSPQIFFTWLEENMIETIPFAAFGFKDLEQLVVSEEAEFVAHAVLRQAAGLPKSLETITGETWTDLLSTNLTRALVYSIMTDIVDHKAGAGVGPMESSIRDHLGPGAFQRLSKQHLAEATAHVMMLLSDDRGVDKVLKKSERHKLASQVFEAICQGGASDLSYPVAQQPSFRAKYLLQILSKLCLSAAQDPQSLWSPPLLVYVCRKLFDDANKALGPLYVASTVRKIRIIVALAGRIALRGYPLEMLLHNLRPYLTNFHCAEDAMGIYWYLLEQGLQHLQQNLSFMAGLTVAIFTSLSVFVQSSQESTTQESQFVSTMSKAKEFRKWLGEYLSQFEASQLGSDRAERFRQIIQSAREISTTGTNSISEPEGHLLRHVLLDQASSDPLLSRTFFHTIVRTLSHGFRATADLAEDILADEDSCIAVAPVLYQVLADMKMPTSFQIWVGGLLGRAYTIKGPTLRLAGTSEQDTRNIEGDDCIQPMRSYQHIIEKMAAHLWQDDVGVASTSEQTLSYVLSAMPHKERQAILATYGEWTVLGDLVFENIAAPSPLSSVTTKTDFVALEGFGRFGSASKWASALGQALITQYKDGQPISGLASLLKCRPELGATLLPMIVHLVLDDEAQRHEQNVRGTLSNLFNLALSHQSGNTGDLGSIVLDTIIYLRRCVFPGETTFASRNSWLNIDYNKAASAALYCRRPNTALLLLEILHSECALQSGRSRRSSVKSVSIDGDLLSDIFRSVSDADFFYGSHKEEGVTSVLTKLQHEKQGTKLLAMQSALLDSRVKMFGTENAYGHLGKDIISALSTANLNGLSFATQQYAACDLTGNSSVIFTNSLLNINQWDLSSANNNTGLEDSLGAVLRRFEASSDCESIRKAMDTGTLHFTSQLILHKSDVVSSANLLLPLAALSEMYCLTAITSEDGLRGAWESILKPRSWVENASFDDSVKLLLCREAAAVAMKRNNKAHDLFHVNAAQLLLHEINAVRFSLAVTKMHEAAQPALNRAIYLMELQNFATDLGLSVQNAITMDVADTLWSQGEIAAPVHMLRSLQDSTTLNDGDLLISKAELLTNLGQKLSQARLDRPDEVMENYLQPAIEALQTNTTGTMAGRVYHNFAAFCDEQLQDAAGKDDFERISRIRNRKLQEVHDLANMVQNASGREGEILKSHYSKAKTWFKLDEEEYRRLKVNRERLLQNCLENYLLSMQACDDFGKDVLRFLSLWLSNSEVSEANNSVRKHLPLVPTLKLAPFVNQLSSRLSDSEEKFPRVLFGLLFRICCEHPYHGQYQIFAVSRAKTAHNDSVAESRNKAASKLTTKIHHSGGTPSAIWVAVHNSNLAFSAFAQERPKKDPKSGTKLAVDSFRTGEKLKGTIHGLSHKIPPPTMHVRLRADKDYSSVPTFSTFEPEVSIAGGVSAPKIMTIFASDGSRHKMLLKGGNDDLRQDAIMEQVFEQVSDLLRDHRPTRQRALGIRTYKVIPLTFNSGIIEFVQNTLPLHDYLLPAHGRYYPKDYKSSKCRELIFDTQKRKLEERVRVYRNVIQNFRPVMRFFFMERFLDPDQWFQKRLNYSRSTAAISILGHVLGVGDRHGHNILLDEHSGEVVHIDLGVAFEAGRVLPVPEVVPFRLTRDIVDGMGISGVEGPFRRCCEFTLEALRRNEDAIMTILDVLRWDPLHSWSVSPVRVARMQEQQEQQEREAAATAAPQDDTSTPGPEDGGMSEAKKQAGLKVSGNINEPSEADRALAVVAKKLSASLSVEATVNELIRQATDELNLAVLYCGWAAYA